ncbi:MAG: hypothetical protein CBB68_15030 [Rhodospirillaceae bacterium TMED8]|nr:2-hydroxychromene-2-carboxylate isomerase [Magnetovibrio sp.]OUT47742.1 MAG: hypothetical protein CBB68_15030 [Rhodospirillaceae bacterium TMED8]|tara:strand:+ start:1827 stop:2468 length:642 start_codon:yes stop_codon:yes gene_type:complete
MDKPIVQWFFDFVSPFAYLQSVRLQQLEAVARVECVPVLFAGFLNYWGQLGPAEVPPKKTFILRQCAWRARRDGIPYNTPSSHPFNPLRGLRLAIALGCEREVVQKIFHLIWVDGQLPDDQAGWALIQSKLEIKNGESLISRKEVKSTLIVNGESAISKGVFGVPTCLVGGELFWGDDCLDMVLDYLADPKLLDEPNMRRVGALTASANRLQR